ncbi:MAG: aromatic aminobenezylarsenical efflux permease ArsG family transporter [Candidatus Sulfomarinibacteraceae bacterium]
MEPQSIAAVSALWLGILTSISPCPLAANVAAVSYVGRHVGSPRRVLVAGALYTVGRATAYLVLGAAAVWSLMSVVGASAFLQGSFSRLIGPMLVAVGLFLLGVFSFTIRGAGVSDAMRERIDRAGLWGALPLGGLLALAFCPVSAALFFGSLVPLAIQNASPVFLPAVYGVGTALPVVVFAVLIAMGVGWMGSALDRVQAFEKWARFATGLVFVGVGIFETLRSTLYLI